MNDSGKTKKSILLDYDLLSLPTAQHKAGLAGLLLMIDSMRMRKMPDVPQVKMCTSAGARISFTHNALQALFDDLFDASWVERKGKKRIEPGGNFLECLYQDGAGVWLKLWREVVWNVLRPRDRARLVYKERAGRTLNSQKTPSSMGGKVWHSLVQDEELRRDAKERSVIGDLSSSVFIGAQEVNAERVPFQDTVKNNLLLHFWPIVSLFYVPREVSLEKGRVQVKEAGYVLVVPEPSTLRHFLQDTKGLLMSLDPTTSGYRPADALIDLPEEGGLEYLHHLARCRVSEEDMAYSLAAVEVYHLERENNNVRVRASGRILPDRRVFEDYESLRTESRNPLYKSQRIKNLLAGVPWHHGMDALFSRYPWQFYIGREGERTLLPFFGDDVRKKFRAIAQEINLSKGGENMSEVMQEDRLAHQIYRLVREYVNRKAEAKSGKKFEDFKRDKDDEGNIRYPKEYLEAREKVCRDAFLAMRGRRDKYFIEYCTGTLCSVPQFLPEEDYVAVSHALVTDWETVKTLAMLALSAHSRIYAARK